MKLLRRRWFRITAALLVLIGVYRVIRKPLLLPRPPRPDAATFEHAKRVRIVRDTYGVPHIHGETDADAAFGLAYANAEDDFPMIQGVLAASTGRLGLLVLSKEALANDYYVGLVRVREQVAEGYEKLSPDYRAVIEAYARGLNLYAYRHPDEADGRLYPMSGRDIAAGFAHKIPLMFDLNKVLGELNDGPPRHAGERLKTALSDHEREASGLPGSNAHAVSATRAPDGVTRLNVNSHQPWEGPVAWYEAQVTSDEGWNMTGGLFPGAPFVIHGHNDHLGWAHTVNSPDLVDVYELQLDPKAPDHYLLDGQSVALEVKAAPIPIDTGFFVFTAHEPVYWSEHGLVLKTDKGAWAIRYAGMGRALKTGEQWFRMNKAKTFEEWKAAMRSAVVPMFNTVYADARHIAYFYNALLPIRAPGRDWQAILPGNERALIWKDYLAFEELPHIEDPPSGFVQNCNGTPFRATTGDANPKPEAFSSTFGIETNVNNRSARSLALLGTDAPVSREDFLRFKWDRTYAPDSEIMREVVRPLVELATEDPQEKAALALLKTWDGVVGEDRVPATIAILTWRRVNPAHAGGSAAPTDVKTAFRETVKWLVLHFGRVEVPWGEVHRLRRGSVDLPLGGGPDVLNGINARDTEDRLVGRQGDSLVVIVDFAPGKTTSESIHQYGSSNRPSSPHYADQAPMAVKRTLKPTWRTPEEQAAHAERSYHPGE
ncbi:MAG: penicillin acylase family protein [Labilithrix sp.]